MNKSIIQLIASGEQSAKAVSIVEKTLSKKLLKAISEQATGVARKTYGTVTEAFGADEQPEFMNPADNTYAVFFANALKKFGVNGPEDFRDEATKQQFFQYVDNNWKAQDSVQGIASQAAPGATMDQGTGTQLPPTATQPQAPQMPMQTPMDSTTPDGGGDPSLSAMSPTGNANSALTPGSGDDGQLDNAQSSQQMGGTCSSCGQPMPEPQTCKCCGQQMPTAGGNPNGSMPGQPMPGQQVQPGADMGDDDSDPDLEIGDEDQVDGDNSDFGQDPEDEQGLGSNNTNGDVEDDNSDFGGDDSEDGDDDQQDQDDRNDSEEGFSGQDDSDDDDQDSDDDDDQDQGSNGGNGYDDEEDEDENGDPFDDDDAYSVSPNDFSNGGSDDDSDDDDQDSDDDDDQDPDLEIGNGDDDDEDDQDSDEDDSDNDSDGYDDEDDDSDDDQDSDDDDDESDDDGDYEDDAPVVAPKKSSKKSKNPFARNEDFGAGLDNAEDKIYITEFLDPMIKNSAKTDPNLHKKLKNAKVQLRQVKISRNQHLSMLRKKRAEIMADPSLSPEQKQKAKGHIAKMGQKHMKHCKKQAQGLKALHTGKF